MMDAKLKIATTALHKITRVPRAEFDLTTVAKIAQTALCEIDAIAPPVAAGNMDTLQRHAPNARYGEPSMEECAEGDYVLHADVIAWGAQQRMEGKREGADTVAMAEQMKLFRSSHDEACIELKERVEKAEAELAQVKRESEHLTRQIFENGYEIQGLKYDLEEAKKPVFILPTIAPIGAFAKKK